MTNPTKTARRVVQFLFLGLFLWLFWQARWHGQGQTAPVPLFLRMDPLAALVTWLAPTDTWLPLLLPGLAVLVATALLGRVFCGWVCPLGTTLDISDHLLLRKGKPRLDRLNRPAWKYAILAAVLASALFGAQLAWLLDPIPLLTRTCATVAYPVAVAAYNSAVTLGGPALEAVGLYPEPVDAPPSFSLNLAVLAVFVGVLGLSLLSRRYWCRTLCPLGALLGLVGRFGFIRRHVEGCVRCGRCPGECKMGAIPTRGEGQDFSHTLAGECIQCYDCLVCPREGIASVGFHAASLGVSRHLGISRRRLLASVGLGVLYGAAAATGAGRRPLSSRLIRPPGAIFRTRDGIRNMTESEFRDLCVRCGNCMKACITGGLQPAVAEAGFDGVFTPILVPKIGYCEQSCTACGQVCPTGALGQFLVREKPAIRLGLATVYRDRCLCWRPGKLYQLCLVCKEHCPYGAVQVVRTADGNDAPVVDAALCTGCGQCEHTCPVSPEAAIVVSRSSPIP